MINLAEFRHHPDRLSDLLNWAAFVSPTVLLNKDGSLQSTIKYRGPDLDSATEAELMVTSARLNHALKRLGSGWALFSEARREVTRGYPNSQWDNPVAYLIDQERRTLFEDQNNYESAYYLTLMYLPPEETTNKLTALFVEGGASGSGVYERILESFKAELQRVMDLCERTFPEVRILEAEETLTYLHSIISTTKHVVKVPEIPMYLDAYLCDTPLTPGFAPKLGELELALISVMGFPGQSHPGLLDSLNRLDLEYRWVTRFICLDKEHALKELEGYKRKWFSKRKGITSLIKEMMTREQSALENSEAIDKANDSDEALRELGTDDVAYGFFSMTLVLSAPDSETLRLAVQKAQKAINTLGFVTKRETVNSVDAWLGTIPGNPRNNIRRPLLHTLNLVHMMPGVSAVWAGPAENKHLAGPPLLYAQTSGSTPFRYVTHTGDVGHTLILGPTGSGKSTLLALMEAQFLRYPEAQVYIFDKGGSAKALTYGVGGDYYELAAEGSGLALQPLGSIDEESERSWAHGFILDILTKENVKITPDHKRAVWNALGSLASVPKPQRTLYGLTVHLQNDELRKALHPYTLKGPFGRLLDSSIDTLRAARWQCFEMETLMETPQVVLPVLSYLFHRLEERFTGVPTMLVLDEAWLFLDHPAFAAKIREWLKVLRKANVMVVFATQSLADIDQSSIAATIKEACFTKLFLPNATALHEQGAAFYKRFGLNDTQLQILAHAYPKRDYYLVSPQGNRLFSLSMGPVALAYCGNSTKKAQVLMDGLRAQHKDVAAYNISLLHELGLPEAADCMKELSTMEAAA